MAKKKQWKDVRLLSFDLETVEFAYALVCTSLLRTVCNVLMLRLFIGLHRVYHLHEPAQRLRGHL